VTDADIHLVVQRTIAAPPEAVFDAWTTPEVLRRWFAAGPDWETPAADVDLRPGGAFRLAMRNPATGDVHAAAGRHVEIDRPRRLVHTWTWEGEAEIMAGSADTTVTVEFRPEGAGMRVVLVHSGFGHDGIRDLHVDGWEGTLANLDGRAFPGVRR
jgi:uncharacterized protein YndB with AHSA1/START domain